VTELRRVDRRGTVNLPVGVRQGVDLVEVVRREDGVIELRPRLVVDPAQAWFWSDQWQAREREADDDVAAGRVKRFNDVEALLTELDEEE
jgi:bifunctional DNA-binding transcriptional regulator/antitoxin component of YhaV-PrlF toxin-antitoxin module